MHLNTLKAFRHEISSSFERAKDALFHIVDALVSEDRAKSLPELSLSPYFERRWPSLYEALQDGRIDVQQLQRVFVDFLPHAGMADPLWIGIDSSGIARPRSRTSADRSALYVHNLPACDKPITYGWQFSTVVALPQIPSSWTYILAQERVSTATTPAELAFAQLQAVMVGLPQNTIRVLDRGYDSQWFWEQCRTLPGKGTLIRLKGNRCFYRVAPQRTGKRGAPRKDGDKLQPKDETTHGTADGHWQGTDANERSVAISWWQHLHVKAARELELTVIRVVRPHASNQQRDPRVSRFVWIGDQHADMVAIGLGYVHRFSLEHGYRFDKQSLLWAQPRLRTPEQFERWSLLVAIAHNLLVLARDCVAAELRPWENKQRQVTPQQVRRAMSKLLPQLGTPTRPPQPRGKSPGRAKGVTISKAKRFAVVKKPPKLPKSVPK